MHLLPLRRTKRPATNQDRRPQLLDRAAAAQAAGVCQRTISRAISLWESSGGRYGLRPAVHRVRLLRIDVVDLHRWIDNGMPTGNHGLRGERA